MQDIPEQGIRRVMHCDLDCFFAAAEELDNPALVGRPVVVGGDPDRRGVVSTANYVARKFGIHSAMSAAVARQLCPSAVFLRPRFDRYRELSQRVMAILDDYFLVREQVSIDEAYGEMPPGVPGCRRAEEIAGELRRRVKAETGLTISVGVARNKSIAKIASDHGKPDGCVIVRPGAERAFLGPLSVGKLSGVGPQTRERLERLGILTVGQLASVELSSLQRTFGKHGAWLWELANARDERPVVADHGPPKSVSRECTYERDLSDTERAVEQLRTLAVDVARRARREDVRGRSVVLKVKWADFRLITRHRSVPGLTDDAETIAAAAIDLFHTEIAPQLDGSRAIRLLGVGLTGIPQAPEVVFGALMQLRLWHEEEGPAGAAALRSA